MNQAETPTAPVRRTPQALKWLLGAIALFCVGPGLCVGYFRATIESDPVYVGTLKRANASKLVKDRLGTPLTVMGVASFSISFKGTKLVLDVAGPRGVNGKLYAWANGSEPDSLEIFKMKLVVEGTGEVISLDGGASSSIEDF